MAHLTFLSWTTTLLALLLHFISTHASPVAAPPVEGDPSSPPSTPVIPVSATHPNTNPIGSAQTHAQIIAGIVISVTLLILLVAGLLLYRRHRSHSNRTARTASSTTYPSTEDGPAADFSKGYKSTYWNEADAPAHHPMLGEAGKGMIHNHNRTDSDVDANAAGHSRQTSDSAGPFGDEHETETDVSQGLLGRVPSFMSAPPPIYTETEDGVAGLGLRPAPQRTGQSAEHVPLRVVAPGQERRSGRGRQRSVSIFREEM